MVIELATAATAIGLVKSLIGLADMIGGTWMQFKKTGTVQDAPQEHRMQITGDAENATLVALEYGEETQHVTREQLASLLTKRTLNIWKHLKQR
ncbi:MAG TPA: hypothetical protein QF533_08740 [Nitrospinota bacterium]|jgi:hypothetical protein|nr:hypothetical protein [Nitrospinota bacterium]MDP7504964.1 hypothetical protein [Nitrospinota bacterium]MDP7664220.1 hypothetical protein [Nitrospinota bacterium]HJP14409.1 hypothetical protein [Nitrospinota bacterium]